MNASNSKKRKQIMQELKILAKRYDAQNDVVLRNQAANQWRELATDSEAKKAPKYLRWNGR